MNLGSKFRSQETKCTYFKYQIYGLLKFLETLPRQGNKNELPSTPIFFFLYLIIIQSKPKIELNQLMILATAPQDTTYGKTWQLGR